MYGDDKSEVKQLMRAVTELVQKLNTREQINLNSEEDTQRAWKSGSRESRADYRGNYTQRRVYEDRGNAGRFSGRSRSNTPPSSPNRTRKLCYNCRKPGHFEASCPEPKQSDTTQYSRRSEHLNMNGLSLMAKPQSPNKNGANN